MEINKEQFEVIAHFARTLKKNRKYNINDQETSPYSTKKCNKLFFKKIIVPEKLKPSKVPAGMLSLTLEIIAPAETETSAKIKKTILNYLQVSEQELRDYFGHSHTDKSIFSKNWSWEDEGRNHPISRKISGYGCSGGAENITMYI